MKVNKGELVMELNSLLKSKKLDLPSFRREVTTGGRNVQWLIKHIKENNSNYNPRIDELLSHIVAG